MILSSLKKTQSKLTTKSCLQRIPRMASYFKTTEIYHGIKSNRKRQQDHWREHEQKDGKRSSGAICPHEYQQIEVCEGYPSELAGLRQ